MDFRPAFALAAPPPSSFTQHSRAWPERSVGPASRWRVDSSNVYGGTPTAVRFGGQRIGIGVAVGIGAAVGQRRVGIGLGQASQEQTLPAPVVQEERPTVGRLASLLLPDASLLGVAFIFLVAAAISQALIPHFLSGTLQAIIDGQSAGTLGYASYMTPLRNLVMAGIAGAIFSSLRGSCFIVIGARASRRLRQRLFRSLIVQDVGFFDTTKTGEITSRLTQDCQKASDSVCYNINIFSRTVIQLITTLCFMLYHSRILTLYSFVTVPVIVLISKKYGDFMQKLSERTQKKLAEANEVAEETLSSIGTVRSFAGEGFESRRFSEKLTEYVGLERTRARYYIAYLSLAMMLPQLCNCFVFFQIGILCMKGLHAPTLLVFVFYLQTLNDCFGTIADFYTNIVTAIGSATRVFQLIDRVPADREKVDIPLGPEEDGRYKPLAASNAECDIESVDECAVKEALSDWAESGAEPDDHFIRAVELASAGKHEKNLETWMAEAQDAASVPQVNGFMKLTGINFSYPARPDRQILKGLDLECPPGCVVALVGPSGGGKSTCISLLQRLYKPSGGFVTMDGRDIWDFEHQDYHQIVSVVGQEPSLFGRTVRENILFGLPDDHPAWTPGPDGCPGEEVSRAAMLANAHEFISAMPQGYDTDVGERGVQLSGGQKQRISIARALVRRPRVLLLDEATSALDVQSELLVQTAISNLIAAHDMTVVIVAHRLSTVRQADKICVVEGGVIVEEGTHDDLLKKPNGSYTALIRSQLCATTQVSA